ncbi:hypothetical protein H311_04152, partial [Anncaliia algerae PRA109]
STIYSLCTMYDNLFPSQNSLDIKQAIRLDNKVITFYKSPSGVSFVFVATEPCYNIIKIVYQMYSNFVAKDPFYEVDMPIKNDLFNPEPFFNELL